MWDFRRLNKERDAYCAIRGLDASRKDEFVELGSESPLFRYVLKTARALLLKYSFKVYDLRRFDIYDRILLYYHALLQ